MITSTHQNTWYARAISDKNLYANASILFISIWLMIYTQPTSFQNSRTDAPMRSPIPTRIPIRLCPILSRNPAFLRYVTLVWLSMWWPGASGYYQITNHKLICLLQFCFLCAIFGFFVIYSDKWLFEFEFEMNMLKIHEIFPLKVCEKLITCIDLFFHG